MLALLAALAMCGYLWRVRPLRTALAARSQAVLEGIEEAIAIADGETQPNAVLQDPGFALTAGNLDVNEMDMWGCVLLAEGFLEGE